jgi:hypothetical protein
LAISLSYITPAVLVCSARRQGPTTYQAAQGAAANISVFVGADSCGAPLMGNPYFFPPHHEEDYGYAARYASACVQANFLVVPLPAGVSRMSR